MKKCCVLVVQSGVPNFLSVGLALAELGYTVRFPSRHYRQ